MIEFLMLMTLSPVAQPALTAQFQPCVWPNPCGPKPIRVAQFQPCVYPNTCSSVREEDLV